MKKLLVICGPTAIGKTSLALQLGNNLGGEIVSADSRQVYKELDIGTGKDLPKNSKLQGSNLKLEIGNWDLGFYLIQGIKVWGYDLVEPTEEFSVAQYLKFAREIIKDIWHRGKLPIVVGGTGLYIRAVVDGIETASIPKNKKLRSRFEGKSAKELFEILAGVDPIRAASMNRSDKKNPRRLVRAIEIASAKEDYLPDDGEVADFTRGVGADDVLFIGLAASSKKINERIKKRVNKRVGQGIEKEVEELTKKGVSWDSQAMSSLGYRQWKGYVEGKKKKDEVILEWIREEKKYAKRQLSWFKKDKRINWFDVDKEGWRNKLEDLVKKWHNQKD